MLSLRDSVEALSGIGPAKAKLLMEKMGTLTAIKNANVETLAAIPGITRTDAEAIYTYYRQGNTPKKG